MHPMRSVLVAAASSGYDGNTQAHWPQACSGAQGGARRRLRCELHRGGGAQALKGRALVLRQPTVDKLGIARWQRNIKAEH